MQSLSNEIFCLDRSAGKLSAPRNKLCPSLVSWSGPFRLLDADGSHDRIGFKLNFRHQHILGSDPKRFDQSIFCLFLGIDPWQIDQPTNPPVFRLLNNGSVFHKSYLMKGISRSLQIFRANSSTISLCRGTCVFNRDFSKIVCRLPSRKTNAPCLLKCLSNWLRFILLCLYSE